MAALAAATQRASGSSPAPGLEQNKGCGSLAAAHRCLRLGRTTGGKPCDGRAVEGGLLHRPVAARGGQLKEHAGRRSRLTARGSSAPVFPRWDLWPPAPAPTLAAHGGGVVARLAHAAAHGCARRSRVPTTTPLSLPAPGRATASPASRAEHQTSVGRFGPTARRSPRGARVARRRSPKAPGEMRGCASLCQISRYRGTESLLCRQSLGLPKLYIRIAMRMCRVCVSYPVLVRSRFEYVPRRGIYVVSVACSHSIVSRCGARRGGVHTV